jgi:ABC-type phosphate transport system substrate-binding protein
MGMYQRARQALLTAACVGGIAAGLAAVSPAAALAECKTPVTGSGSTLQTKQQEKWAAAWKAEKSPKCEPAAEITIEYNLATGTGSKQGLEEWGMAGGGLGGELLPALSSNKTKLDGFVGTDDPPTEELTLEGRKASESTVLTVPVVAAPVAALMHLPGGTCTYTQPAALNVTQAQLLALWLNKLGVTKASEENWSKVLTALGFTTVSAGCAEQKVKHKARKDGSGTSDAFKYFLCQIEGAPTCPEWKAFANDGNTWPANTEVEALYEGTGAEVKAVAEAEGSVGYANYQNARTEPVGNVFTAYSSTAKKFWLKLEDQSAKFAEPGKGTEGKEGNCPTELTTEQQGELPTVAAEKEDTAIWDKFHLSGTVVKTAGTYALCTLTYDEEWENYLTTILKGTKGYESAELAETTALTVENFILWILGTKGQVTNLEQGYSKLPEEVQLKAVEIDSLLLD